MKRIFKTHRVLAIGSVMVAALAIGGIAYAVIPGGDGIIHGCYDTKTGQLRVIDPSTSQVCASKEAALDWNQTGPQGPAGPAGQNGTADAFARISSSGIVNLALSKNISDANVTHPQTGVYCIGGLVVDGAPYSPKVVVGNGLAGITADAGGNPVPGAADTIVVTLAVPAGFTLGLCPDTATVRIFTYAAASQGLADRGFQILLDN